MDRFLSASANADDWAHAAKECCDGLGAMPTPEPGNDLVGFLYLTDGLAADSSSILTYMRQKTGVQHWCGTTGIGIISNNWECHDTPGLAVMVGEFPRSSFHIFSGVISDYQELPAATRGWMDETTPGFGIVHGDPTNESIGDVINSLALGIGGTFGGGFLVGGLSASRGENYQIADRITGGGASGIAFGPGVEVATGLSQGCNPLGPTHLVTDAVDNVLMGLDGNMALDVLKEDVGELLARDLQRIAGYVHVGLPVMGSDTGDYMVRNLVALDPERGWLAIGGNVTPGDRIIFVRRDPASARADMDRMLNDMKSRIPTEPKGGLYFSCVSRGPNMFGAQGEEARMINNILGDVPLVGFFGNGEISDARLYAYTGVLALFF
jgi:small ligand-binding sensory domain FIST